MNPLRLLSSGDRVAIVAPASSCSREQVEAGAAELTRLGFDAVFDEAIFTKGRFSAGSAEMRAKAINVALADPSIAALVAVRGGYGSVEVLPLLDKDLVRETRKALIGYSDITAILSFYLNHGLSAIHGPMIDRRLARGADGYDEASFRRVTMSAGPAGELRPAQLETLHEGDASGVLVGGTLTQLAALLGTPWALKVPPGAVMFLEDIKERPYRVHRLLTQLEQAGALSRLSAIVFGEFPGCDEPGGEVAIRDVLHDFTDDFRGPVVFGFPSGHTSGPAWTLPLGVRVRVVGNARPLLIATEAAVA